MAERWDGSWCPGGLGRGGRLDRVRRAMLMIGEHRDRKMDPGRTRARDQVPRRRAPAADVLDVVDRMSRTQEVSGDA